MFQASNSSDQVRLNATHAQSHLLLGLPEPGIEEAFQGGSFFTSIQHSNFSGRFWIVSLVVAGPGQTFLRRSVCLPFNKPTPFQVWVFDRNIAAFNLTVKNLFEVNLGHPRHALRFSAHARRPFRIENSQRIIRAESYRISNKLSTTFYSLRDQLSVKRISGAPTSCFPLSIRHYILRLARPKERVRCRSRVKKLNRLGAHRSL